MTGRRSPRAWRRRGRVTRRERRALAVLAAAAGVPLAAWGVLHAVIGPGWAGYLAGTVSGAAVVVLAARPRLDGRVRLRGGAASRATGGASRGRRAP